MNVAFDARLALRPRTGLGRMALNLLREYVVMDRVEELTLYLDRPPDGTLAAFLPDQIHWEGRHSDLLWANLYLRRELLRRRPDILHFCNEKELPFGLKGVPSLITIADLIPLRYPKFGFRNKAHRLFYTMAIRSATRRTHRILTLSQQSKRDLMELLKIPEEKIAVVPLAAEAIFTTQADPEADGAVRRGYGIEWPYILAMGALEPRKNNLRLICIYERLLKQRKLDHRLVILGGQWRNYDHRILLRSMDLEGKVVFPGLVPDDDLPALFRGASLFAFLSLYEGFGLPALEAMACGTPVIASNRTSVPEVMGDGGCQVDPECDEEIEAAICSVLENRDRAQALVKYGIERASRFSWRRTAEQVWSLYEEMALCRSAGKG